MDAYAYPVVAGLIIGVSFVTLFSYFSAQTVFPLQVDYDDAIITLERTVCYGICPDYSLTIYGNGTVLYEGRRYVAVIGEQTSTIPKESVRELVDYFHSVGYFSMQDRYAGNVGDVPTVTTSIQLGERFKKVVEFHDAPARLKQLEDRIDEVARSERWVNCPVPAGRSCILSGGEILVEATRGLPEVEAFLEVYSDAMMVSKRTGGETAEVSYHEMIYDTDNIEKRVIRLTISISMDSSTLSPSNIVVSCYPPDQEINVDTARGEDIISFITSSKTRCFSIGER